MVTMYLFRRPRLSHANHVVHVQRPRPPVSKIRKCEKRAWILVLFDRAEAFTRRMEGTVYRRAYSVLPARRRASSGTAGVGVPRISPVMSVKIAVTRRRAGAVQETKQTVVWAYRMQ